MLLNNRIESAFKQGVVTFRHLHLLRELIRRDFYARFTGSALGVFWAVIQPILLVLLYWFVFTFMFKATSAPGQGGYIYYLIAGLIPWLGINEGLVRSTTHSARSRAARSGRKDGAPSDRSRRSTSSIAPGLR